METNRKLTQSERDKLLHALENWDKPLSPPRAVPKSVPKKKGRPKKEE